MFFQYFLSEWFFRCYEAYAFGELPGDRVFVEVQVYRWGWFEIVGVVLLVVFVCEYVRFDVESSGIWER